MRGIIVAGAFLLVASGWPTGSHDVRRTSQSDVRGPRTANRVSSVVLSAEQTINMPVTVADDGTVFAGTWGVVRSGGSVVRSTWDKFDGKVFAFDRLLERRWERRLDLVPYCYAYGERPQTPGFCPNGGTINGYNGTVEGVITLDPARGRLYAGRGDGKLYAIDAATGAILWRFTTFNPLDKSDPEGGGEVVAGPLVGTGGVVYFATVRAGDYETNAVYAVGPDGSLLWRYPSAAASMAHVVWAAPALSPDGRTLYVAGGWGPAADEWNVDLPGAVYAFDAANGSLRWVFHPVNEAEWWKPTVWTTKLAVGTDGTIYGAGTERTFGAGNAVLYALRDLGTSATYAWPRMVDLDRDRAAFASGIALRETGGHTRRVYATSGNPFSVLAQGYAPGGKLAAVDASTGGVLWRFDPELHGGTGSMTGMAVDAEGMIYTGVAGATSGGRVFAVREDGSLLWQFTLGGLLEWAHPVLGPAGDLYVGDSRRCIWMAFPIESGLCSAFDIDPRLYLIEREESRRRSVRH